MPMEYMPGRPDQSIDVITAPIADLVKQRPQRLLRVGNHLVVFHLLQQFFHGASVYLHDHFTSLGCPGVVSRIEAPAESAGSVAAASILERNH